MRQNLVLKPDGGTGMRYTARIVNAVAYLFFENPRWFVEEKQDGELKCRA